MDYEGRVIALSSRKNWPRGEMLSRIAQYDPLIIATDKAHAVKLARELKTDFGVRLYAPHADLTHEEKAHLTRNANFHNRHERDALASAMKAYHSVENKMRQVARHAQQNGNSARITQMRSAVLRGVSIHDLLRAV